MKSFFSEEQIWHITHGLFIPIACIFLSYYLGKLDFKLIKNPGIKSLLMGTVIGLFVFLITYYFSFFSYTKKINIDNLINQAVLCGVLSAESMIYIGEHKHLEFQKICMFLFLYFHNLDM
jgi:hypothetical protein